MSLAVNSNALLIVSSNEIFREGLRRILVDQGFDVIHAIPSAEEWPDEATPDLAIVAAQAIEAGLHQCALIRRACCTARIVLMMDEFRAEDAAAAFRSGAIDGFLVKAIACEPLGGALRLVAMGERLLPSQAISAFTEYSSRAAVGKLESLDAASLSARELEILSCLIAGDANKIISRRLQISEATVKVHVKAILRKLHVSNRTQAAIWGVNHGMTPRPEGTVLEFTRPSADTNEPLLHARLH